MTIQEQNKKKSKRKTRNTQKTSPIYIARHASILPARPLPAYAHHACPARRAQAASRALPAHLVPLRQSSLAPALFTPRAHAKARLRTLLGRQRAANGTRAHSSLARSPARLGLGFESFFFRWRFGGVRVGTQGNKILRTGDVRVFGRYESG
jgi:hypothetical protein